MFQGYLRIRRLLFTSTCPREVVFCTPRTAGAAGRLRQRDTAEWLRQLARGQGWLVPQPSGSMPSRSLWRASAPATDLWTLHTTYGAHPLARGPCGAASPAGGIASTSSGPSNCVGCAEAFAHCVLTRCVVPCRPSASLGHDAEPPA